jgi:hypothetical protein
MVSTACLAVSTACLVMSYSCLVMSYSCLVMSYKLSNNVLQLSSGYVTAYGNRRRLFEQPLMEMDKDCLGNRFR